MSTYLKNMVGYKHTQLKNKSFEEIQMLFEKEMKRVNIFVDMDAELVKGSETIKSEVDRAVPKLAAGSSKGDAEEELDQESYKRQKTGESSKLKNQELKKLMNSFDRDDLVKLWSLVKEKFNSTEPTDDKEREIWLYDSCGVHHVSMKKGINIYMLVEKEYPLSRGTLTWMLIAKLLVDQDNEMSKELLRKIFMQ
ncbi:hypothetical protein Tco_1360904, partial [Tanacetum coccineum]